MPLLPDYEDRMFVDVETELPGSVFELANACERPLPQYHPRQLHMLIMSNWFERANAIIMNLGRRLQDAVLKAEQEVWI